MIKWEYKIWLFIVGDLAFWHIGLMLKKISICGFTFVYY